MEFSVLISIYNKEKEEYLRQCLESIMDQTVKAKEIVIVKDGPLTYELDKVIDNFSHNYPDVFKIVELQKNVGLGKALAIGIEKCSCELVARMDSDDIARSDRFEKQILEFSRGEIDLVGSHIIEFEDYKENIIGKRVVPLNYNEIVKYSKLRNPFNHVTIMYRKSKVIKVGNYKSMYGAGYEDYLLWLKMIKGGCKVKNIDDYLVYVRSGLNMFERRGGMKYILNTIKFRHLAYQTGCINIFYTVYATILSVCVS
ncbi:MAG: glycosyltransferase, partial [Clostridium sp.]